MNLKFKSKNMFIQNAQLNRDMNAIGSEIGRVNSEIGTFQSRKERLNDVKIERMSRRNQLRLEDAGIGFGTTVLGAFGRVLGRGGKLLKRKLEEVETEIADLQRRINDTHASIDRRNRYLTGLNSSMSPVSAQKHQLGC